MKDFTVEVTDFTDFGHFTYEVVVQADDPVTAASVAKKNNKPTPGCTGRNFVIKGDK